MIQSSRLTFPGSFATPLDARYDHPVGPIRAVNSPNVVTRVAWASLA